jgi:hypothetical protein
MTDYAAVLLHHPVYKNLVWTLNGDDYDGLTWLSDTPKPTQAELDAAWPDVQASRAIAAVQDARRARYLAETDPMFLKAMRDEEDGVTLDAWKAAVAAIKADLPYPA